MFHIGVVLIDSLCLYFLPQEGSFLRREMHLSLFISVLVGLARQCYEHCCSLRRGNSSFPRRRSCSLDGSLGVDASSFWVQ